MNDSTLIKKERMRSEYSDLNDNDEFLVVGLVRNCSSHIKKDLFTIKSALDGFNCKVYWLIIESDSSDDSVLKLTELVSAVENFRYVSLGPLRHRIPSRVERIAFCRNKYLEEIRTDNQYDKIKYVVVADFDGLNTLISSEAIASSWERLDWDVCTANQDGPYFDIWALRHEHWSPNDCLKQYKFLIQHNVSSKKALYASVHSRMIKIPKDSHWIEVDSAFGGFAIYRRHALIAGKYNGLSSNGDEICEHVPFHDYLKNNGFKIYINPRLINAGFTEHTVYLSRRKKAERNIKKYIKKVKNLFIRES